jgi:hypothetical protein
MRRSFRELLSNDSQIDVVALLKRGFADLVLLLMMSSTETDCPSIRGLEPRASVGVAPDMRAFDRPQKTAGDTAVMFAYPRAVSGALAAVPITSLLALKPVR